MAKSRFLQADPNVIIEHAGRIENRAYYDYLLGRISEDEYKQLHKTSEVFMDYAYIQI